MKKKQKSELRVSRRCIEVERERDSFRSGWSKKCVIGLGLLKDIKECGFSAVFKIDGIRLYYYNELWKMVNGKNHAPLDTPPKFKKDTEVYFHEMKFDGPMERAEWIVKQPIPSYMYTDDEIMEE